MPKLNIIVFPKYVSVKRLRKFDAAALRPYHITVDFFAWRLYNILDKKEGSFADVLSKLRHAYTGRRRLP